MKFIHLIKWYFYVGLNTKVKSTKKYEEYINKENTYDKFYNPENNVPEHYKQMLKKSEII